VTVHAVGVVLHPARDSAEAVDAVLGWAARKGADVFGIGSEIVRLNCAATPLTPAEIGPRSDLLVSIGWRSTATSATMTASRARPLRAGSG
jgi:NAD+ kinase